MEILLNSTVKVYDAIKASEMLAQLSYPIPADWPKVNSFFNPLGESPARAYLLLLRKDLDGLDLDSGDFTIKWKDDDSAEVTANKLLISREPQCITPGKDADENSLYLVEFSDARHTLQPGHFSFPINEQYNVRAAGYGTDRYDETENAGSAWTWSTMTEDVWNKMTAILGAFTSLPVTPDGSPEDWKFPGVSAWTALNQILHRIGCAVKWDHTLTSAQYSIVQLGATDSGATTAQSSAAAKLIYDRMYMTAKRGKLPGKLVVYFGRRQEDYGTEQTTPKDNTQFTTSAVVSKEITLTTTGTDANTKHHVWDDLPAEFDVSDGFTPSSTAGNDAALQTRAQERADDFERMVITGGGRLHKVYTGIISGLATGSTIKGVAYRQDLVGYGTGRVGGLVTEIINHPYWGLRVEEHPASPLECWGLCQSSIGTQAPAFGPTFPLYPHLLQIVELTTGTADGSARYTAKVELYDPDARTWTDKEDCYAIDINALTTLASGSRFLGRLSGMDTDKPVYQIDGGAQGLTVQTGAVTYADATTTPINNVNKLEFDSAFFALRQPTTRLAEVDWLGFKLRKNSTGSVGQRRRLNMIEGAGVTITYSDDSVNDEHDVTIAITPDIAIGAKGYNSGTQNMTAGAAAAKLTCNAEEFDTHTIHSTGTMTFASAGDGIYEVHCSVTGTVTFSGSDITPEEVSIQGKLNSSDVRGLHDCGMISRISVTAGSVTTAHEHNKVCLHASTTIDITDSANDDLEIFATPPTSIAIDWTKFTFSVHKLNRAGAVAE